MWAFSSWAQTAQERSKHLRLCARRPQTIAPLETPPPGLKRRKRQLRVQYRSFRQYLGTRRMEPLPPGLRRCCPRIQLLTNTGSGFEPQRKDYHGMSNVKSFRLLTLRNAYLFVIALALSALILAPAARADAIYYLTYDGCTGGCGPQDSFGTVTLHGVDANTVEITVSLLNNNKFVTTGSHVGFAFNVQGDAVTLGTLPTGWADAGINLHEDGFGTFSNGINCIQGNSNAKSGCAGDNPWVGDLIFNVSRATGLTLDDFVLDAAGYSFSADILSGTTGLTGPVASAEPVPEIGTLAMIGTGVLALAGALRRRQST